MGDRYLAIFGLRKNREEFPAGAAISKLDVNGARYFNVVMRDITVEKLAERN